MLIAMLLPAVAYSAVPAQAAEAPSKPGLVPLAFEPLAPGVIKPAGWLKEQLRIQADGLSGHLDEFWPDIKDSGWIGGKAEGWERVPYWLDGVVPLAWLLDDAALKKKAIRYIDYAVEHQKDDGWLGPEKSTSASGDYQARDPWPLFVMFKVFAQYYDATGDARVTNAMLKCMRQIDKQITERPLFDWNKSRWQDLVFCVHWLYDRTGEAWLLDFADKAHKQGYDWMTHFRDLPVKERIPKWTHETHVVNNAMAIKTPGVWYRQSGQDSDRAMAATAIAAMDRYHGTATGAFTGDECLAGKMPSQGTETCAVVEYTFSLEVLLAALGEPAFGDRLERLAFNALPAPFKPDMWAHQYDQQANQVVSKVSDPCVYGTNGPDSNLFGLEPNYGCCTANMHQGWPKFATNLWMRVPGGGLAAMAYAPCSLETKVKDVPVRIQVDTTYPFSDVIKVRVEAAKAVAFPLQLRVPAWAVAPTLKVGSGDPVPMKPGTFHVQQGTWEGVTELTLRFPMQVTVEKRFNGAAAISRGPLVYSLKIGEDWRYLRGEKPHADWEVHPTTPWNYALALDTAKAESSVRFEQGELKGNPFAAETAPVALKVKGKRLPGWDLDKNAAAAPPQSPVASGEPEEELTLIPYGSAKLRVTEFPILK